MSMKDRIAARVRPEIAQWLENEDGAVTTDWVVLTAGIVTIALIAISSVSGGTQDYAARTGTELADRSLGVN